MESHDTWVNRCKLTGTHLQQTKTSNFKKRTMLLSPLIICQLFIYLFLHWMWSGKEVSVSSSSPWILEGMWSWSGFILWAGGREAGNSPNSTNWDNQMTFLIRPRDAATGGTVWTCNHTEVCLSVQTFLKVNDTFSQVWVVGRSK